MRRIIWTAEAVGNLRSIFGYVSAFNAPAASRLRDASRRRRKAWRIIPNAAAKPRVDFAS